MLEDVYHISHASPFAIIIWIALSNAPDITCVYSELISIVVKASTEDTDRYGRYGGPESHKAGYNRGKK